MQANTTSPRLRVSDVASWIVAIFGVILLVLLFLSFALEARTPKAAPATTGSGGRIAYFEFGSEADTLWLASAANPSDRKAAFVAPHASEFGVVPSISPDGRQVVYTALSPQNLAPGPDSPADLWLASLTAEAEPRLLAGGIDLLIAPVWSPSGDSLIYRRSVSNGYVLASTSTSGSDEHVLVSSPSDQALFPVGFTPDGSTLYDVALSDKGTQLFALDIASGVQTPIAQLSDGLTRDWALSPDGSQLAYLALTYTPDAINSRAYVVDLSTAQIEPVTDLAVSAFGPVWDASGALVVGTLSRDGEGSFIRMQDGATSKKIVTGKGFDVPLAFSPSGAYLVRTFEGASAATPGHASLTLIDTNGERHVLTSNDVTLVGWSTQ
jgi:Tol biopolymer transport system component